MKGMLTIKSEKMTFALKAIPRLPNTGTQKQTIQSVESSMPQQLKRVQVSLRNRHL